MNILVRNNKADIVLQFIYYNQYTQQRKLDAVTPRQSGGGDGGAPIYCQRRQHQIFGVAPVGEAARISTADRNSTRTADGRVIRGGVETSLFTTMTDKPTSGRRATRRRTVGDLFVAA